MNCGTLGAGPEQDLLYVNFNQDYRHCLVVGTRRGFSIYNCEPFGKCYERDDGAAGICEMLFSSSLVAVVGAGEPPSFSPRKLQIINTKVLAVLMNRKRLVVVLDGRLHIYDLSTMKIVHTVETPPNPGGVAALSPNAENCYLAYPSSDQDGAVQVLNTISLQAVCAIQAHRAPVNKMAFSHDGKLLATASDRGTILRVFAIPAGQKIYQFRRGSYPATIYSLSFNLQSNMLCVTSDSDTVHIFRLVATPTTAASPAIISSILPERIGEAWESARHFCHLKLPSSHLPSLCALSSTEPLVMVATADGFFLLYSADLEHGGECRLLRKHSFHPREDAHSTSNYSL